MFGKATGCRCRCRFCNHYTFTELSIGKAKTEAAVASRNVALDVAVENLTALDGRTQVRSGGRTDGRTDGRTSSGEDWRTILGICQRLGRISIEDCQSTLSDEFLELVVKSLYTQFCSFTLS